MVAAEGGLDAANVRKPALCLTIVPPRNPQSMVISAESGGVILDMPYSFLQETNSRT